MEMKAYIEGILRRWWLLVLVLLLSFWLGTSIADSQKTQYTVSTTILLNDSVLTNIADSSNIVQLATPLSYESQVANPAIFNYIIKYYPRLSGLLGKDIVVTTDPRHQLLLITVTDTSPRSVVDIANFLAQKFVETQNTNLKRQLNYYENWLQQNIVSLTKEINTLNLEIEQLTPAPAQYGTLSPLDPRTQRIIATDQFQVNRDESDLYNDQRALKDIQNIQSLFDKTYIILQPATPTEVLMTAPLPASIIELIAVGVGLFVAISLIITLEYFSPFVRHKGELQRIAGFSVLGESSGIFDLEQKHILHLRPTSFRQQVNSLRLLSASIGAKALKDKGHVLLLTSPQKKRNCAADLARALAQDGYRTLLINADFENPSLDEQIKQVGPCDMITNKGLPLSFIRKTVHSHLFLLPATAILPQGMRLTNTELIELLPELQIAFSIIIIDAPPLNHAGTHLLATKVTQMLLLVKKRRDSLKVVSNARSLCQELKLDARCLLLG
jgi:capsular polysaccharide biosynthesis protein